MSDLNLNFPSSRETMLLISEWVSGSKIELKSGSISLTPLRNISKILCRSKSVGSSVSSWAGPNVATGCDLWQSSHDDCWVSKHQNKVPTVCRRTSTMSVPGPLAACDFSPRKVWQQRRSEEIAEIAIHASGRARMDSSCHTS